MTQTPTPTSNPVDITNLAETVSKTGADPVLLAAVIVFGLLMVGAFLTIVNRMINSNEKREGEARESTERTFAQFLEGQREDRLQHREDMREITASLKDLHGSFTKLDERVHALTKD